ncbi:bifunctional [glutamate--ammonia ligase]-adenylyl-L-tyrosine phosphorylase/[glutamate--ammonia-ligase] adenylyltransferase [Wenzhouxiangella limi]|uniref:Bifunctional [glutamate--ammonia ligase]-adenylyl-L-tyrosine phosphorylase/[glutamate--ammonia-ligase] adenylyltransferase n=1 Tax=Wenzhouxiangella limi TaxID=2707351 RepID=A0A845V7L9_9GAMM|nr:bifunctional [glutamate--ammonia ligase]-adenylyl-L-tyrosine phosphorylase/[glutamate--ammonia-ligase] adenylyltransferase [Wenzhouxiangella limi]NDY95925.1 bifunctional [glutamate--ammonia ligase]-adenylyl-L-tyrosine phosphorylase/[glutamate--ammonia-ligase] adenylyltransferase [Wenzhouxiangella limi]
MKRPVHELTPGWLAAHCRFVDETWRRFPDHPDPSVSVRRPAEDELLAQPEITLRRYRQLQSVHILWQDLAGMSDIATTGCAISALARDCLELALVAAEHQVQKNCGELRDDRDRPLRLAVLGLGKLGGNELNFNSDIDIVFVHDGKGESTGPRRLDAGRYHQLVARELIRLLDTVTSHGRVWIVDARLRPFGDAGALVWSLLAMEQYFLTEGRTWERYAWLKAAPVAGDLDAGKRLLAAIEPFIYRRYLDYGIFDSLRELHARIEAGTRSHSGRDIKRGPDGIRAAEFLVQSQQILRGGRDRMLRVAGFLPGLEACAALGLIEAEPARELQQAYGFLRILENRLQAMTGRQGHHLPCETESLQCLAELMGHADPAALDKEIAGHQARIGARFSERFRAPANETAVPTGLWPPQDDLGEQLTRLGFENPDEAAKSLVQLDKRLTRRNLSAEGHRRLERLLPELLLATAAEPGADALLPELLRLIEQISRRSSYLSLLHERPQTLTRLVRVFSLSERVSAWITEAPQLLDDLLDPIHGLDLPALPASSSDELEESLNGLGRWRQAGFLRTALAELDERITPVEAAERLSLIAETILAEVLRLLDPPDSDIAVIGYGNLGARALHYESDLDLVFLHGTDPPPLRIAQRLISLMQMPLPGGRLFEIDTRLRPNGRAGMLISRVDSFGNYQDKQAWTWEHQALIRARWVNGSQALQDRFERIRQHVLCQQRDSHRVLTDLADMRARQQRDRSETPIKGLMTDIQYIAEAGVLCQAAKSPELIEVRRSDRQIDLLRRSGWLTGEQASGLIEAWNEAIQARHICWLQRHPDDVDLSAARRTVSAVWQSCFGRSG